MNKKLTACLLAAAMFTGNLASSNASEDIEEAKTVEFKEMLRDRIVEVLDSWPAEDQYAVMFFIYPNQSHEYRGYADLPEFSMLYRCESELGKSGFLFFRPSRDGYDHRFWGAERLCRRPDRLV